MRNVRSKVQRKNRKVTMQSLVVVKIYLNTENHQLIKLN